jgi:hypothetical protein
MRGFVTQNGGIFIKKYEIIFHSYSLKNIFDLFHLMHINII